eukprot:8226091-Lingulodinium_polyedra.AAC.1
MTARAVTAQFCASGQVGSARPVVLPSSLVPSLCPSIGVARRKVISSTNRVGFERVLYKYAAS